VPRPDEDDAMMVLTPILPELRVALAAVLPIGFGQVTLHIEHGSIQRVVFSCSLKKQGLTTTSNGGTLDTDNEI